MAGSISWHGVRQVTRIRRVAAWAEEPRWPAGLIDSSLAGMLIDSILREGEGMENLMISREGRRTFRGFVWTDAKL